MKKSSQLAIVCLLALGFAIPVAHGSATQSKPFEPATIVSVHKHEVVEPPYSGGDNPSDAPLRSEFFAYDVAVRTTCGTYVAHYESPYDYFPDAIAPNRQLPVQVGKHNIAFDLGFRQMQMPIAQHKKDKNSNCR